MQNNKEYSLNWREKIFLKFGTPIIALLIKLWGISCRLSVCEGEQHNIDAIKKAGSCIYSVWHQRMFYFFHYLGSHGLTAMVSKSKDGEFANAVAVWLGFKSVRGSTTQHGRSAMLSLIRKLNKGGHKAGMLVDGPTGPPRIIKMGTIKIAKITGNPIIPVAYGARNKIVAKSWDRYFLPLPFSKIIVIYGEPVSVPGDADKDECERIRKMLEVKMNEMADQCDTWWGGNPVGKPGFDLPKQNV